jgi:hypothetical protein
MATMTGAQFIAYVRLLTLDTNSSNYGLTDAQLVLMSNDALTRWYDVVEPRVKWLTPTALGGASLATNAISFTTTPVDIQEILSCFLSSAASATDGAQLEKVEPNDIFALNNQGDAAATPTRYAVMRAATATAADVGKWTVFFHPKSPGPTTSTTHISAIVKTAPPAVIASTPSTEIIDVSEAGGYTLARIVAARAATLLGRDERFVGMLMQGVPEDIQQSMMMATSSTATPRTRVNEKAV